ncbi:MBG domain-containing protein [Lacticaseibacillus camelliae]|uniref:MBG domain-containing protein n=1 Tax=Lacticaseibacillus camelliae TaxID=381742 RepID=UPI0006D092A9|nr:MBG domain-containing protein [Lacticaseibacillus camelliae]
MEDKHLLKRLSADMTEEKRHYKLYKDGKQWALAGISLLFAGTVMMTKPAAVHADVAKPTIQASALTIATVQSKTAASQNGDTYDVQLAAGVKAPTWVAGDFTCVPVAGQTDQYTVTLSAQGLAALQAANPAMTITANQITAGTLTIAAPSQTQPDAASAAAVQPAKRLQRSRQWPKLPRQLQCSRQWPKLPLLRPRRRHQRRSQISHSLSRPRTSVMPHQPKSMPLKPRPPRHIKPIMCRRR